MELCIYTTPLERPHRGYSTLDTDCNAAQQNSSITAYTQDTDSGESTRAYDVTSVHDEAVAIANRLLSLHAFLCNAPRCYKLPSNTPCEVAWTSHLGERVE